MNKNNLEPLNGNRGQEAETYPLDDALIAILTEVNQQMQVLQAHRQGALRLFFEQHKLQGKWDLAENGRELVKASEAK